METVSEAADWSVSRHDVLPLTFGSSFLTFSVLAIFYLSVVRHGVDVRMWTCVLKSSNGCGVSSLGV